MTATPTFNFGADNVEELTEKYFKLRDGIKAKEEEQKTALAPYKALLAEIEAELMNRLVASGADSIKTKVGTIHKTTRRSATVKDMGAFRKWVIDNEAWDIADLRANGPSVGDYVDANGVAPPGLNYTTFINLGVRRS